jgi:hypothetical protein
MRDSQKDLNRVHPHTSYIVTRGTSEYLRCAGLVPQHTTRPASWEQHHTTGNPKRETAFAECAPILSSSVVSSSHLPAASVMVPKPRSVQSGRREKQEMRKKGVHPRSICGGRLLPPFHTLCALGRARITSSRTWTRPGSRSSACFSPAAEKLDDMCQ